jgi:general secretion pathway protein G
MKLNRTRKGFTLIELLIVVAIIGIIAAIAIPNLLNAIQRGKQKRTMADMRAVATSAEAYAVDNNLYPAAGYTAITGLAAVSAVAPRLEPTYIKTAPRTDGWKNNLYYGASGGQAYQVLSYGKDGGVDDTGSGATTDFNEDIVFENGQFVVYPEGVQN